MKSRKIEITLGYDPELAGPGFTVNDVASFDIISALSFVCDLLRHQGAPVPDGLRLPIILAAPDLLDSLILCVGRLEKFIAICPDAERAKETLAISNAALAKARLKP